MKNVIITGADGFLGSNTAKYMASQGVHVLGLDIADEPGRLICEPNIKYKKCDVSCKEDIFHVVGNEKYDTLIHFAWIGSSGEQRGDYEIQCKNAIDAVELMKTAAELGIKRFLCSGTIMEREVRDAICMQGNRPGRAYIYGIGKYLAHALCKTVAADIGIELVWPMVTNAYGPGEMSPRFINTTLRKIINGESLQFTAGTQNYDFVYIDDVARAFYLIAKEGKSFCEYIIGSSNAQPLKNYILEMRDAIAPDKELIFGDVPYSGTDMSLEDFDTKETKQDCGFEVLVTFREGIIRTYKWLLKEEFGDMSRVN